MVGSMRFVVNGRAVEVATEPDALLVHVLRNDLGLVGTRCGCCDGRCGSCTIIIDGAPHRACMMPMSAIAGRRVETVEGLAHDDQWHPLQQALIEAGIGQCGFCLSGIMMRAKALLGKTPRASRRQIAAFLDGNLCRCGAHPRVLNALVAAGRAMAEARGA